jgi:hypothetical protein
MPAVYILMPIVISLGFFLMIAFIVWSVTHSRQQSARYHAEVQTRLIDRFSSGPELIDFLKSPEGQRFAVGIEKLPALSARDRVVGGFTRGILLGLLGLAFLVLEFTEIENPGFAIAGAVLTALGLASIISAFIAMRLSKSFGLMGGGTTEPPPSSSVLNP